MKLVKLVHSRLPAIEILRFNEGHEAKPVRKVHPDFQHQL